MSQKTRTITQAEKEMFLALTPADITKVKLSELFANSYDVEKNSIKQSKFNTYDLFTLKKGEYHNDEQIVTNCGLLIVNKYLFEKNNLFDVIGGYCNTPFDKKQVGKIDSKIATWVQNDTSGKAVETYIQYMNDLCWLGFTFNTEICASITLKSAKPLPDIQKEKRRLLKENAEAIKNNDTHTAVKIYNELVDKAAEELKDDPSIELYQSGARGAFDNAYRQAQIMKGPVWNEAKGRYDIMTNSLYEGAEKEDLPSMANAVVGSMYTKAIGPGESGYLSKKLTATFQSTVLGEQGSDCKSKGYLETVLTPEKKNLFMYIYMIIGDKLVRLDDTNWDKYVGKKIKYRSPMMHIKGDLCNACAGDRYYLLGIKNIGLTSSRVANSFLNYKMKASHDTTVHETQLKPENCFVKLK